MQHYGQLVGWLVILQLTVSQPVFLGIGHPPGTHDQILIIVGHLRISSCGGALPDERTGL
jgi:hypothetical protein